MKKALIARAAAIAASLLLGLSVGIGAQGRAGQTPPPAPPPTPKAAAPIDLTGYWVSVITQDWRQRMITPAKGDYASVPLNVEAKKIADAWDPAKDEGAGDQCKAYGAPAIMRHPTRVHITWQDDTTLKVETDTGTQTRVFHFGNWKSPKPAPTWQGDSVAEWQTPRPARAAGPGETPELPKTGSLKVVTTNVRPGYLRKNGIPYSGNTVLTEYWDVFKQPTGDQILLITSMVEDPMYLREPWITALHFKKEPSGAKWDPVPCSAK
jgi:hypothetical protein